MIPILAKYSKGDVYFVIIRRAPFKMFVEKKYLTTVYAYLCKLVVWHIKRERERLVWMYQKQIVHEYLIFVFICTWVCVGSNACLQDISVISRAKLFVSSTGFFSNPIVRLLISVFFLLFQVSYKLTYPNGIFKRLIRCKAKPRDSKWLSCLAIN